VLLNLWLCSCDFYFPLLDFSDHCIVLRVYVKCISVRYLADTHTSTHRSVPDSAFLLQCTLNSLLKSSYYYSHNICLWKFVSTTELHLTILTFFKFSGVNKLQFLFVDFQSFFRAPFFQLNNTQLITYESLIIYQCRTIWEFVLQDPGFFLLLSFNIDSPLLASFIIICISSGTHFYPSTCLTSCLSFLPEYDLAVNYSNKSFQFNCLFFSFLKQC